MTSPPLHITRPQPHPDGLPPSVTERHQHVRLRPADRTSRNLLLTVELPHHAGRHVDRERLVPDRRRTLRPGLVQDPPPAPRLSRVTVHVHDAEGSGGWTALGWRQRKSHLRAEDERPARAGDGAMTLTSASHQPGDGPHADLLPSPPEDEPRPLQHPGAGPAVVEVR